MQSAQADNFMAVEVGNVGAVNRTLSGDPVAQLGISHLIVGDLATERLAKMFNASRSRTARGHRQEDRCSLRVAILRDGHGESVVRPEAHTLGALESVQAMGVQMITHLRCVDANQGYPTPTFHRFDTGLKAELIPFERAWRDLDHPFGGLHDRARP